MTILTLMGGWAGGCEVGSLFDCSCVGFWVLAFDSFPYFFNGKNRIV